MLSRILSKAAIALFVASLIAPQTSDTAPVRLSAVRELGCHDCSGPEQFSVIQALAVDSSGGIYVADRYAPFIRVWSSAGRPTAFVGAEGHGPGEFQRVSYVSPATGGGFFAIDRRLRRLTLFGPQGKHVRTMTLSGSITQSAFSAAENKLYAAVRTRGSTGCRATEIRRWTLDGDDGESSLVAEMADAPLARFSGCPAAAYSMDAIPDGGVGVAFGFDEYLLLGFDSMGSTKYKLTHDVARVPRTSEEMEAERDRLMRFGGGGVATEPDPLRSHFTGGALRYDSAGRAWIRTERGAEGETIFDVFSAGADYLGEVTLPIKVKSPGRGFDLAGDYMVTVHVAEPSGTEFVTLWQASWSR